MSQTCYQACFTFIFNVFIGFFLGTTESKIRSMQRVLSPTPFPPLIHLSFTYTSALSVSLSLPAGVRFLCKAAWMSMEIRVLSVLLIHFSLWSFPSSQEQGPQSQTRVRALDASARTMAGRGGGVRGLGSIDGQGYVLSGSLAAFAFFCFVVTRKRKRYGSLFKRTIHTWEITRLGRDGALK